MILSIERNISDEDSGKDAAYIFQVLRAEVTAGWRLSVGKNF